MADNGDVGTNNDEFPEGRDAGAAYDAVAGGYADAFAHLDRTPFDRDELSQFAAELAGRGLVADLGCGPGHGTAFLAGLGVEVFGVDVSAAMVDVAQRLQPGLDVRLGDMADLDVPD